MLPHDTDPFSPTRKKSDPFQDGDIFGNLDPFDFEFARSITTTTTTATIPTTSTSDAQNQSCSPSMKINNNNVAYAARRTDVFNGPLQVSLPPESNVAPTTMTTTTNNSVRSRPIPSTSATVTQQQQQQQQQLMTPLNTSNVLAAASATSALKQQTAEVISSISNKKMGHLFGQTRFSKRSTGDSNNINMRRLQESDSLSENETAPEPPPRPDSVTHIEPPPLPPKKQFNDNIIIRPRITATQAQTAICNRSTSSGSNRYDKTGNIDVPPIPLPSRRVGRTDGTYPGPGRPRKPTTAATTATAANAAGVAHNDEQHDYLTPISLMTHGTMNAAASVSNIAAGTVDVPPPLLPPPAHSSTRLRGQRQQQQQQQQLQQRYKTVPTDIYENKNEIIQQQQQLKKQQQQHHHKYVDASILQDITLSQLLTLSTEELALKLNVPLSKLTTMTLVELTKYLAEFLEKSNKITTTTTTATSASTKTTTITSSIATEQQQQQKQANIFRVNLDQQTTFMAKFDDNFGEGLQQQEQQNSNDINFVANFAQFNEQTTDISNVPLTTTTTTTTKAATKYSRHRIPAVPSADRYAVFREIIDQDLQIQQQQQPTTPTPTPPPPLPPPTSTSLSTSPAPTTRLINSTTETNDNNESTRKDIHFNVNFDRTENNDEFVIQPPIIDTKITEAVAQAKDRYAALRDIILVENLFDNVNKKKNSATIQQTAEFAEFSDGEFKHQTTSTTTAMPMPMPIMTFEEENEIDDVEADDDDDDIDDDEDDDDDDVDDDIDDDDIDDDNEADEEDEERESSLDSNDKEAAGAAGASAATATLDKYEPLSTSTQQLDIDQKSESSATIAANNNKQQDDKFLTVSSGTNDAITNLSASKDDLEIDALMQRAISNLSLDSRERISPAANSGILTANHNKPLTILEQAHYNDMSTSPISLPKTVVTRPPSVATNQVSPVLTELSAVSSLIDSAGKHLKNLADPTDKSLDSWATFDSTPRQGRHANIVESKRKKKTTSAGMSVRAPALLTLPPAPPSNASQNDTAESPCSSDARDDALVGSGISGRGKNSAATLNVSGNMAHRRWHGKENPQTSSSSRDLSPWDDELPVTDYQQKPKRNTAALSSSSQSMMHSSSAGERHVGAGYYMCHNRRMNSCDEDYE